MESFFKTLKVERICQVRYDTRAQARLDIVDWIEGFYNRRSVRISVFEAVCWIRLCLMFFEQEAPARPPEAPPSAGVAATASSA